MVLSRGTPHSASVAWSGKSFPPNTKRSAPGILSFTIATVRQELDLMRHLSQEMGARVARLQVCFVFAFPQLHKDLDCINPQT